MSIYHRIKRRLGCDTTETVRHTNPVYEYRIHHTNGDTSEVIGHGYNIDGAFARFYKYTDAFLWHLHSYGVGASGQIEIRVLGSIKEIKQEKVGETVFEVVVDKADGDVIEKDVMSQSESEP